MFDLMLLVELHTNKYTMIKTHVYVLIFISFKFYTQKVHGIMHDICVPSFKTSTSFLSCHLNSTRGYKHLNFYHLPLN